MIVKNEEGLLQKCLDAVGPYVDEIIVVDTGSTDSTKEIALGCKAKVYDFPWCDDFAAARNFSLTKASHDWVLVLDADEVLTHFDKEQLKSVMTGDNSIVGRITLINLLTDKAGEKRSSERISRLFNRNIFHYEGCIHEQVVRRDGQPYPTVNLDITALHSGYSAEVIKGKDKITRNTNLLQEALHHSPEDTYLLYQLGKSHYLAGNFTEAVNTFTRALQLPLNFSLEYAAELVQTYGYALINSERYAEGLGLTQYEQYYAQSPDYLFVLGLVYMNNGMFSQAIVTFLRCKEVPEGKTEGINSWLPTYNIAVIYECLGKMEEATAYYKQCGNYRLALQRLNMISSSLPV